MHFNKAPLILSILLLLTVVTQAQPKHKPVAKHAAVGLKTSIANGLKVYTDNCVSCHQADGGGIMRMNPPLIKTSYVLGDRTKLIKIVLHGFSENVEINGQTYSNVMASHDELKDQEIADVLTYVRNSFGNKASAVTAAQVKAVRAQSPPAQ